MIFRALVVATLATAFLALFCGRSDAGVGRGAAPTIAPRPEWVSAQQIPVADEAALKLAEDGIFFALYDTQTRLGDDDYTLYYRAARQVTDRVGLEEAGRFEFTFDSTEDEFFVHSLNITRDGQVIDKLAPDAFTILRREPDLESGVTDGELTAYFEIPDIRVGDIIDYEVSWRTRSKIWPGQYFSDFMVEWSVPTGLFHRSITTPRGKPLTITKRGSPPEFEFAESPNDFTYVWRGQTPAIIRGEDAVPESFPMWSSVSTSTISTWREVVETLLPAYGEAAVLPEALAGKIVPIGGAIEDRVTRAIRYVQDEIRYVADETGVGSHLPRRPETVVRLGWGDCKDKALLLVSILRAMDVDAYVALTDNDEGHALPQSAPSPFAFDHAIVVIDHNGKRRWIDATQSHQGGVFPEIAPPAYGYALALKADSDGLWPIEAVSAEKPELRVTEAFDFAHRNDAGVDIAVTTEYRGQRADSYRRTLAEESRESLTRKFLDYYEGLYPGISTKSGIGVSDDRDRNEIRIREEYLLPAEKLAADGLAAEFPLQADAVRNLIEEVNTSSRRAPVALPFPLHAEHIVSLKNTGVTMGGIDGVSKITPDFEFVRNAVPDKDSVWISWRFKTLSTEVPLDRISDYRNLIKEMSDWNAVDYNLEEGAAATLDAAGIAAMFLLAFAIVAGCLAIWAGVVSVKADAETIDRSIFYPVDLKKFVVLGFATLGLYALFWMYRCWRQLKRAEGKTISAAGRAFFSVIFFYPLFSAIRSKTPEGARPQVAIGALLAAGYAIFTIVSSAASRAMKEPGWDAAAVGVSDAVIFLFAAPLVVWVNRLNAGSPDIVSCHSRWTLRTGALLAFGLSLWPLVVMGALTPE